MGQPATNITAPVATVELLTYIGDPALAYSEGGEYMIPHSFLKVTDVNGQTSYIGFAPEATGLVGTGEIFNNSDHLVFNSSGPISLLPEQGARLQDYVNSSIANPPEYNLPGGSQCAVWALNGVLNAVTGTTISPTIGATSENPLGPLGTIVTELVNPYTIAALNEGYQLGTQFYESIGYAVGEAVANSIDSINSFDLNHWLNLSGNAFLNLFLPEGLRPIDIGTSTFFTASTRYTQPRRDPLTFDLDGDGLETVGTAAGILFDHDADGVKTGTGWVKADDALLVRDVNGNGTIDNGRELFGDATMKSNGQLAADGFDALADLDSNADGQITSADSAYSSLRLWRDLNQDGISQSGELFTLDDLGIASINVASTEHSKLLANGNQVADLGTYTKTDGTTGSTGEVSGDLGDINLATDTFHRSFTDTLDTSAVASLPDMQGSGAVRDLKQAASQSAALAATLASLGPNTTRDQLKAAIPTILQQWADGAAFTDSFEAAAADDKDLFFVPPGVSVLDAYNARYAGAAKFSSINGTLGTVVNDGEWRVAA